MQRPFAKCERGLLDTTTHYFIDAEHLYRPPTFREVSNDEFVIYDDA